MPALIEHIDAIARKLNRGVLFLSFGDNQEDGGFGYNYDWENSESRKTITEWLDTKGIGWRPCAEFANLNGWMSYRGQIYLDVPYDKDLPIYQELEAYLEHPDGTFRFPDIAFIYLPLEIAMRNSEHDEPGFWERWAENF